MGKSEGSSDDWLVTYGDLVTLLLVFFVLLYTLTPGVEETAFNSFISYFQKNSGFFEQAQMATESAQNQADPEQVEEFIEEQLARWEAFTDFLEEQNLESDVNVKLMTDGVLITLSDSLTFRSGSDKLLPKAQLILQQVSKTINNDVEEIEVQGHTDNVPLGTGAKFSSNWHLGAARAVSVVQYLQTRSQADIDRFKASSYGEYRPVADNATREGRRKNRRVEIYLRDEIKISDPNPVTTMIKPEDDPVTVN